MYPFKVKVLNICTGGVKTNLTHKSIQAFDIHLPQDSLYLPIEAYFKKRQGYSNANAIPAEEYARQVVNAVNNAKGSGWIWKGYFAWTCWFLSTFFWKSVFDFFMLGTFGLRELRKILDEKKKKQ
jgi:1-acylglycerone phosphate reductase